MKCMVSSAFCKASISIPYGKKFLGIETLVWWPRRVSRQVKTGGRQGRGWLPPNVQFIAIQHLMSSLNELNDGYSINK